MTWEFGERGDVRSHRNISTIEHCGPAVEGVGVERDVVAAAESHFA